MVLTLSMAAAGITGGFVFIGTMIGSMLTVKKKTSHHQMLPSLLSNATRIHDYFTQILVEKQPHRRSEASSSQIYSSL